MVFQESTEKFRRLHQRNGHELRLGQLFCNRYIRESWPELYYETNPEKALAKIDEWLVKHCYFHELPMPIKALAS